MNCYTPIILVLVIHTTTKFFAVPEAAPIDIRYEYISETQVLEFTWEPLPIELSNGEIVKYEVSLKPTVSNDAHTQVVGLTLLLFHFNRITITVTPCLLNDNR